MKQFSAYETEFGDWKEEYELELTNFEVKTMFRGWCADGLGAFLPSITTSSKALLADDIRAMNGYMNRLALEAFSYF